MAARGAGGVGRGREREGRVHAVRECRVVPPLHEGALLAASGEVGIGERAAVRLAGRVGVPGRDDRGEGAGARPAAVAIEGRLVGTRAQQLVARLDGHQSVQPPRLVDAATQRRRPERERAHGAAAQVVHLGAPALELPHAVAEADEPRVLPGDRMHVPALQQRAASVEGGARREVALAQLEALGGLGVLEPPAQRALGVAPLVGTQQVLHPHASRGEHLPHVRRRAQHDQLGALGGGHEAHVRAVHVQRTEGVADLPARREAEAKGELDGGAGHQRPVDPERLERVGHGGEPVADGGLLDAVVAVVR